MSIVTDTPSLSTTTTATTDVPATPIEETAPDAPPSADDTLPFPRPFESLRAFYARTSQDWQSLIIQASSYGSAANQAAATSDIKELKRKGFEQAEQRWWDCREEVVRLEDELEEGGVGEIVSLGEKNVEGGAGRRR
jgi:hypothetical protein